VTRWLAPVAAQIEAELKMRLRSFATLAALLAFLAAAFLWLPDPGGNTSSLSWHAPDGTVVAPVYTSGYVGLAITLLGAVMLTLFGFFLVAGSVRRDREKGVGAILAATPISGTAYLCGKFAAHAAYLFVVAALALPAGLVRFARWGEGPFLPGDFLGLYVLSLYTSDAADE
jgi:ABC-type transport system involved in multi-copper enzyme maturation permease subunit